MPRSRRSLEERDWVLREILNMGWTNEGMRSYANTYLATMLAPSIIETKMLANHFASSTQRARAQHALELKKWFSDRELAGDFANVEGYKVMANIQNRDIVKGMGSFPVSTTLDTLVSNVADITKKAQAWDRRRRT